MVYFFEKNVEKINWMENELYSNNKLLLAYDSKFTELNKYLK